MFPNNSMAARVYFGEILGVDPSRYVCKVRLYDGRIIDDISWLSPYAFLNGNGLYVMPQPNAAVLVLEYSSGSFVVLGFPALPFTQSLDRTDNRRRLSLGDICIQGSDQCYMLLRRGCEVIEIQTTPKCKIILNSNDNTILVDSQRFKHVTDSGVMVWDSDPKTRDTAFHWTIRDKADPNCNLVELIVGFHVTEDPDAQAAKIDKSVFSLIVKEVKSEGDDVSTETKLKIIIGANGSILCDGESVMEKYRDFIDRYADSYITDIAKDDITRTSLEKNIFDTAEIQSLTKASLIRHNES